MGFDIRSTPDEVALWNVHYIPGPLCILKISTLGSPVVPFYPFSFWVPLLKPNSRKKGTLIIKGLLGNLEHVVEIPNTRNSAALHAPFYTLSKQDPEPPGPEP